MKQFLFKVEIMRIFSRSLCVLIPLIIGLSCNGQEEPCGCTNIDTSFSFEVVNKENVDLLDPKNPESIKVSDFDVYFLLNGEKVKVFDPRISHMSSFPRITEPEPLAGVDRYILHVILNSSENEELPTTYLEWKDGTIDILEAEFSYMSNSVIVKKLWLNEDLIWDMRRDGEKPIYSLVKDFKE
ncbi:hypothetical protein J2X69_000924 [Algoriphagus sp. 4150]|uniref:hypothetical protein n=1 Tax=Algoriphagus sp. 4150 TaxID=2817756 RepID=UPI00285A9855|nr:hypothetical protein [Algoriphagus sp. 4150]MDR7128592.1 hypothetical protein [Algoriphagus sp. 4150]